MNSRLLALALLSGALLTGCDQKPADKPVAATPAMKAEPARAPATPAMAPQAAPVPAAPGLPPEVTGLAERIETCIHFGGEEPYDKERAAEIRKATDEAKCGTVGPDEAAMRAKYADNPAVLKRLTDADNFG